MDAAFVRSWVEEIAHAVEAERDHLTQLDAAIGDADHGVNMHRGFSAVVAKLAAAESSPRRVSIYAGPANAWNRLARPGRWPES